MVLLQALHEQRLTDVNLHLAGQQSEFKDPKSQLLKCRQFRAVRGCWFPSNGECPIVNLLGGCLLLQV